MAEEDKARGTNVKCAFEYFADIIKVLQINCLMPNWHGIVSLSFRFTLPALLPSQHIDCALLTPQTPLPQASYFHSVLSSSLYLVFVGTVLYCLHSTDSGMK